jgi:hypothetical protein
MLIAVIGSAITAGEYRGLLAFAIFLFGFIERREKRKDSWPPSSEHKQRTGFFVPRFS